MTKSYRMFAARTSVFTGERVVRVLSLAISAIALAPLLAVVYLALGSSSEVWPHISKYVLPEATITTLLLMLGVATLTAVVGVVCAWLVAMCRFPGRRLMDVALLLPFAVPTYIIAFSYVELMDYTGPVQTLLRDVFGFHTSRDYWFPEIRSLGGAVFVMGFVLYPYVYLAARASFLIQSACTLDVSRTLGAGPLRLFYSVALPLARPAIVVGLTLALLECLNDIGAVTFFGVKTLTFAVYDTWLNRSSLAGAAQIAVVMLALVLGLMWLESFARRKQRFHQSTGTYRSLQAYQLTGVSALAALAACALPVLLGFILPAGMLLSRSLRRLDQLADPALWQAAVNSLWLAIIACSFAVAMGLMLTYNRRLLPSRANQWIGRIASIGYAIPGTILAVGILLPVAGLDNMIASFSTHYFGFSTGLLLLGSGTALIYAYCVRFLAVAYGQLDGGFGKITPHYDMAARTLGHGPMQTLGKVHVPLLRPVLLSAILVAFVECMKELPATLLLRPFNFETLSTTVYNHASMEAFEDAALPSLVIVAVGIVPVIMLARTSSASFRNKVRYHTAAASKTTLGSHTEAARQT